jgi:hypothetical protein
VQEQYTWCGLKNAFGMSEYSKESKNAVFSFCGVFGYHRMLVPQHSTRLFPESRCFYFYFVWITTSRLQKKVSTSLMPLQLSQYSHCLRTWLSLVRFPARGRFSLRRHVQTCSRVHRDFPRR